MFQHLKFVVRYWSSLMPAGGENSGEEPSWIDYSVHPASKLGLHNALLAMHDRLEILAGEGGYFDCAVFLRSDEGCQRLSQEMAEKLFATLPHGRIRWLSIGHCDAAPPADAHRAEASTTPGQMPLFPHVHTPYDDLEIAPHLLDVDA